VPTFKRMPSWTTRSGRNFWSVKLSTLNPDTKIIFTARADNLLHLHSTTITIHRFQSICFRCNLLSPSSYWKLAISFRIVHRGVHELAALQLQITDTLCDCDGNIMIFGLVLCYTRWMQASTCLSKKLRERVTLTFTDPKMHYCCWVFKRAEFRCSFVGMRPWPASQRKDSCMFSIICRCKSMWIKFRKSCSQRTHPTFTWQQARTE